MHPLTKKYLYQYGTSGYKQFYRKYGQRGVRALQRDRYRAGAQKFRKAKNWRPAGPLQRGRIPNRFIRGVSRSYGYKNRFQRKSYEKKFVDFTINKTLTLETVGWDAITSPNTLVFVPRGTGPSERIGRKIFAKYMDYNITVVNDEDRSRIFEVKFVLDRQCNGAGQTDASKIVADDTKFESYLNMENSNRFRILKKLTFYVDGRGNGDKAIQNKTGRIDLKNLLINFDDTDPGSGVGNLQSNNIQLIYAHKPDVGDTTNGHIQGQIRLRYTD